MDEKDLTTLHHSRVYDNFLMHWKYIKREKVGDKWKYTYKDDLKTATNAATAKVKNVPKAASAKIVANTEKVKNSITSMIGQQKTNAKEAIKAAPKKAANAADKVVQKSTKVANDVGKKVMKNVNDYYEKNIYETGSHDIDAKKKEIEKTAEWQKIVKEENPEYVKKNADGSKEYLIDDYLVKKKHPTLDVIDDLGNGREISVNQIDADALAAGAKDYVDTAVQMLGLISYGLKTKFKLSQGSYKEELKAASETIENGAKYCNDIYEESKTAYKELEKNAGNIPANVNVDDLEKISMAVVTEAATEAVKNTSKEKVKEVAKDVAKDVAKGAAIDAGKEIVDYYDEKRKRYKK